MIQGARRNLLVGYTSRAVVGTDRGRATGNQEDRNEQDTNRKPRTCTAKWAHGITLPANYGSRATEHLTFVRDSMHNTNHRLVNMEFLPFGEPFPIEFRQQPSS